MYRYSRASQKGRSSPGEPRVPEAVVEIGCFVKDLSLLLGMKDICLELYHRLPALSHGNSRKVPHLSL